MWLVLAALFAALLIGLAIVARAGWSLWGSVKALGRSADRLGDRLSQASDQLSALTESREGRVPAIRETPSDVR